MNKREKELQQAFLNNEKGVLKSLEDIYKDALDEINSKIEILMARQDADMQHVIYQVQYQQSLKKQVEAILETMHSNEFETISDFLTTSYEDGFIGALYNIQGQGIPLALPIDPAQVTQAIQADTKLSETLYKALGKDITALKKNVASEISRGFATGAMFSEIARNVASQARIPLNNAMRITRTEAHRIQTKAGMDACVKAKERGADVIKQWDSALDKQTRDSHVKLDGERRELDKPFSNGLMYAGDPSGRAEEVINCRCAILQRAKWALDADETKHLGDMSGRSDEELAPLAKKLHMDVPELRSHQDEIVPINASSYSDFKKKYNQLWKYEGSEVQARAEKRIAGYGEKRVRSSVQKIKAEEVLEGNKKSGRMEMNLQFFSSSKHYGTFRLPKDEYAHVMSEINTHMTEAERKRKVVTKAIGNHYYTFENNGFDDYRILDKRPIDDDFAEWWDE